jgi:hypothetical protein
MRFDPLLSPAAPDGSTRLQKFDALGRCPQDVKTAGVADVGQAQLEREQREEAFGGH